MALFINPGSGAVRGATLEEAAKNIEAFVLDVRAGGAQDARLIGRHPEEDCGGRFAFKVLAYGHESVVEMPGLPLERVRYMDAAGQSIWDFPRLYVDGSSWVWKYAIDVMKPDKSE